MAPELIGFIGVAVLLVLLAIGVPVAFAMGIVGFAGLLVVSGSSPALGVMRLIPYATVASWSLSVIPLFILMGCFAFYSGLIESLFSVAHKWIGRLPGGLAIATVAGGVGFGALCGSTMASASVLGNVAVPEMRKFNYDRKLATGVVASAGTLAVLIPPSIAAVIYGILTGTPIGKVLIAGIIPGLISATLYTIMIMTRCTLNPNLAPAGPIFSWREKWLSFKTIWAFPIIVALVLGGMYSGLWTPTEAGGIGAAATFVLALSSRKLGKSKLAEALAETTQTTSSIFGLMVGAFIFSKFLTIARLPVMLASFLASSHLGPLELILGLTLVFVFLGCFIDALSMQVLVVPFVFQAIRGAGFDPIWFGVFVIKMVEIAVLTPPFGINVFVVQAQTPDVPLEDVFRGVMPFLLCEFVSVAIFVAFPQVVLFLPRLMS